MQPSLTLERPGRLPRAARTTTSASRSGVPPSWRETRRFSGGGTLLIQFTSPPLAADKSGQTVHASLTLTVEPLADGRQPRRVLRGHAGSKLGDSFQRHRATAPWRDGYVDVMRTETPIAVSHVKRFYRVERAARLLADLRGPRRRLPARVAVVRLHRRPRFETGSEPARRHDRHLGRLGDALGRLAARAGPPRDGGGTRRARAATSRVPRAADGVWEVDDRAGPRLPRGRTSRPTTSTSRCPESFRGRAQRGPRGSRSSTSATATRSSACSTPPRTARRECDGPLQGRRAALATPSAAGAAPLPARALPAARLRPRPHPEPGRLLPHRVPPRGAGLARRGQPRSARRRSPPSRRWRPCPELRKMPGRFYPINYLFIEITNACNFKCTWCPDDDHGPPARLHEEGEGLPHPRRDRGEARLAGPALPGEAPPDGRADAPPGPARDRGPRGGPRASAIELNTNCGLITRGEDRRRSTAAGLTNLILSYQTPDPESFKTRKAPRLVFDEYRDKVRLAVERKVALGARTNLEIDIMNTKHADGYAIVSEDEQALAFLADWIALLPGAGGQVRPRPARPRLGADPRGALPRPGRERQPLHAARRRRTSSGSAATPGAT